MEGLLREKFWLAPFMETHLRLFGYMWKKINVDSSEKSWSKGREFNSKW